MNKQIKMAVCPICHGTGCIGTTDWLTRGIDKEKLSKKREEALAEYEAQKKRDVAREIFEGVKQLIIQYRKGNISEYWLFIKIEELQQKYESEGE